MDELFSPNTRKEPESCVLRDRRINRIKRKMRDVFGVPVPPLNVWTIVL